MECGGAVGSGGYGATPMGTGSSVGLVSARTRALNAIDVTFSSAPKASDPASADDALDPGNWSLQVLEPFGASERLVQHVEAVDELTVRVFVDAPLTPGATYVVTASERIVDTSGAAIDPDCREAAAEGIGAFAVPSPTGSAPIDEPRTDLANPWIERDAPSRDAPLGTLQINDRGDYALERGRAYLRKRILRRATTAVGGFFHLPDYGFAEPLKGRVTPGLLARMQSRAQAQVRREPDVIDARVAVSQDPDAPGVVRMHIRAIDESGTVVVDEDVPLEVNP